MGMYSRFDYLLFVYFLILPSLLHSSILFNCFYACSLIGWTFFVRMILQNTPGTKHFSSKEGKKRTSKNKVTYSGKYLREKTFVYQ